MSKIERVIIIGWDGAGNFITKSNTPNLDRYIKNGTFTYEAQTVVPTISAQCWGAMLHGVEPEKHGLTNDKASQEEYALDSPYPSIFKVVRDADPNAKLASFTVWSPINFGIVEPDIGVHKVSLDDADLGPAAADYIRENPDVKLMFIAFDHPDGGGHKFGYNTPEQFATIERTDEYTEYIFKALEEKDLLKDSLIIFAADHGGGGEHPYGHGSAHPLDKTIYWGCTGPGIKADEIYKGEVSIKDTAAVVIHALGLEAPTTWEGKVPEGLFAE